MKGGGLYMCEGRGLYMCEEREVMHLSMLSPRGGDPGHMWGI